MDIYVVAGYDAEDRLWLMSEAVKELASVQRAVAELRIAEAIALLRQLVPDATEVRFRVEDSDHGGKYAVIHRIDDRSADSVLFDVDAAEEGDVDYDELTAPEDFLAGAAEAGATFKRGQHGSEYVLRLVP